MRILRFLDEDWSESKKEARGPLWICDLACAGYCLTKTAMHPAKARIRKMYMVLGLRVNEIRSGLFVLGDSGPCCVFVFLSLAEQGAEVLGCNDDE